MATMTWEEQLAVAAATDLSVIRAVRWAEVREHTLRDDNLQSLQEKIKNFFQGITSPSDLAPGIRDFFPFKHGLNTVDGVILYNIRTVIPSSLGALILARHTAFRSSRCLLHDLQCGI